LVVGRWSLVVGENNFRMTVSIFPLENFTSGEGATSEQDLNQRLFLITNLTKYKSLVIIYFLLIN